MNEHPRDLDRETAEQLLGGASPTGDAGAERRARLLAAAGGPPRPYEFAREEEAVAAFHAARKPSRRRLSWRSLLTFKVLAVTATITVGGLAFASTAGILPDPFKPPAASPSTSAPSLPGRSTTRGNSTPAPVAPSAANDAVFSGLCESYLKRDQEGRAKSLETKPYAELVTAAGGRDKVEAYCVVVVEEEKPKPDKSKQPPPPPPQPPSHAPQPPPPHASRK